MIPRAEQRIFYSHVGKLENQTPPNIGCPATISKRLEIFDEGWYVCIMLAF